METGLGYCIHSGYAARAAISEVEPRMALRRKTHDCGLSGRGMILGWGRFVLIRNARTGLGAHPAN
jgi:hypothetical protein